MAPKRTSSAKRKADADSDSPGLDSDAEGSTKARASKKAKLDASEGGGAAKKPAKGKAKAKAVASGSRSGGATDATGGELAPNGQPTNKAIPAGLAFPPRAADVVRVAAWNICGLAAAEKKGFKAYVQAEDPDVLVLTETKVNDVPADPSLAARFPHRYWAIASKKGYAGTAILSKVKPLSVSTTLPGHPDADGVKGRIVTLEFESCFVVGTYVPNAGTGLKTLDVKNTWNEHFTAHIRALDARKPVIWTGDLNVAPTDKDLANPRPNWNKTAGYTEAETRAFARILEGEGQSGEGKKDEEKGKFVDVWRAMHPDARHYTYFSYRFNCRGKGIGWRLDMFVVSARLQERARMCEIRGEVYGASDHCPVVLELAGSL
ncbi:DNA-lyase [Wolfiporia cocos MD-104 SS10]|uniref:DNA-(apurinic or apyrimidinic site) endonuclease n=1 Tax=Wolfiporia cocos (strain MD-104) TaxID=742152 RepID=A0A2H3J7F1_WOLCO|nr:DNA-lyase [Wolfiporia cocos MD-104 SS10]